jgi:hypothetical protein
VVAASRYRTEGKRDVAAGCPTEVRSYADHVFSTTDYRPDAIFMLDVCESGGMLHVLELNSLSCSGLYDCEPEAVVTVVARLAVEEWERARTG